MMIIMIMIAITIMIMILRICKLIQPKVAQMRHYKNESIVAFITLWGILFHTTGAVQRNPQSPQVFIRKGGMKEAACQLSAVSNVDHRALGDPLGVTLPPNQQSLSCATKIYISLFMLLTWLNFGEILFVFLPLFAPKNDVFFVFRHSIGKTLGMVDLIDVELKGWVFIGCWASPCNFDLWLYQWPCFCILCGKCGRCGILCVPE